MPIDTLWFFEIFLAGFVTVWIFRYFTDSNKKYAEFEWFALSGFWGIFVIATINSIPNASLQLTALYANPFATGFTMSIFGALFGYSGSRIARSRLYKYVVDFFGKNGKDKSGDLF